MQTRDAKATTDADIIILPENKKGQDYVTGDIHGSPLLADVIKKLTDDDRLFLVGDLTDRGTSSALVVKTILENTQQRLAKGLPPQIYAVQGNHEDLFLDYYYRDTKDVFLPGNGGDWIKTTDQSTITAIAEYFSTLPYIIHVEGKNPFNVVHADMPFDDAELLKRVKSGNAELTEEEITYALWARIIPPDDRTPRIKDTGRRADSIPTYCGHTVAEGVRKETNHINLDVGTYLTQVIAMVNHTAGVSKYLFVDQTKLNKKLKSNRSPKEVLDEVHEHLKSLRNPNTLEEQKKPAAQPEVKQPGGKESKAEVMDVKADSLDRSSGTKRKPEEPLESDVTKKARSR